MPASGILYGEGPTAAGGNFNAPPLAGLDLAQATNPTGSNRTVTHTNRLIHETSPYLRQHAHNPVDWYPWSEEALAAAKANDLPIFLSIGYSACHWCHVMERESFEDADTAAVMNAGFINIKVDREERPDLDAIYMEAVQLMTRQGGWPMSVFLLPDGTPFHGGTYFPPIPHQGMPSFRQVLQAVSDAYGQRRSDLTEHGRKLVALMQSSQGPDTGRCGHAGRNSGQGRPSTAQYIRQPSGRVRGRAQVPPADDPGLPAGL